MTKDKFTRPQIKCPKRKLATLGHKKSTGNINHNHINSKLRPNGQFPHVRWERHMITIADMASIIFRQTNLTRTVYTRFSFSIHLWREPFVYTSCKDNSIVAQQWKNNVSLTVNASPSWWCHGWQSTSQIHHRRTIVLAGWLVPLCFCQEKSTVLSSYYCNSTTAAVRYVT